MGKRKPIDVFEEEILVDHEHDLVNFLLGDEDTVSRGAAPPPPKDILQVDTGFMDDVRKEAERELNKQILKEETEVFTAPSETTPSAVLRNVSTGVMGINLMPGSPLNKAMANPAENDKLLGVLRDNKPNSTILKVVMEEIAEEAAYIKAFRNEHWGTGEDLSDSSLKRIKILKHLVETIIEQERLKKDNVSGKVDFHGEAFQKVLKYFLETIQKTFGKVNIPVQYEDIFFTELAKSFDNFEKNAERIYYGKD